MEKLQLAKLALTRGSICHWKQPFGPHFAVILNLEWPPPDDVVFFSIMTSKVAKFPASVTAQIIRTSPKDYPFLSMETIIDLRQVHAAKLTSIAEQPEFGVRGTLTPDHLDETDRILRDSMTVEQTVLDRVVR